MSGGKQSIIDAFFQEIERRIAFTRELHDQGRDNEAMLLCCCYIDGLASNLYSDEDGSHRNFVRAIREHGGAEWLTRIHVRQLRESLEKLDGSRAKEAVAAVQQVPVTSPLELATEHSFLTQPQMALDPGLRAWLERQLWRGTLASVIYTRLRVPAVHGLGSPAAITFDDSTVDRAPVPAINFEVVRAVAERVCAAARDTSARTGMWFGRW